MSLGVRGAGHALTLIATRFAAMESGLAPDRASARAEILERGDRKW